MIDKHPLPLEFVDRLVVRLLLLLRKRTSKQWAVSALRLYVEH
jgi:hypothetical protein